ncbi:MspA family porin [Gordonia sp. L191]|uniref:MspA family porin n=1 Tax=Gordonia sp. L191 TaxID=2982699 RepID=UPI0024C02CE3|nr:MspA family porin [Gordonia sp. L191]WHU45777.1 MspA family porin [Gordonia sp. L191]
MKKIITRRVAAGIGVTGAALMAISGLGAGEALAGPVPNTTVSKTLVDGTPVTVELFGQNVNYQNSIVESFNLVREVWVSGKVRVTVGGEAEGATVAAGYIVGCQVNIGLGAEGTGGVESTVAPGSQPSTTPSAGAGTTLSLGPGQAGYVPIVNTTDSDGDGVTDYTFTGNKGGVAYSQETFKVSNCGGFAEAKAKVTVTVDTPAVKGVITLYGKPFSIG